MIRTYRVHRLFHAGGLVLSILVSGACGFPEPPEDSGTIPAAYASSHMPQGWWTNQEIIESGRKIYLGNEKSNVNCSRCHGENGVPNVRGAPDFRNTQSMKKYSDSHLFWRITEGVPYSSMSPYRGTLSEEQIWKVIAFIGSLGMGGLHYDPETKSWVPAG